MFSFKSAHADDCTKVSAHHQKVVSVKNVCLSSYKQIKSNFPIEPSSLVNCVASSPIQIISSLAVRGGSGAEGILTPSLYATSKSHSEPVGTCGNTGKVSLGFGWSQQSAPLLLAL